VTQRRVGQALLVAVALAAHHRPQPCPALWLFGRLERLVGLLAARLGRHAVGLARLEVDVAQVRVVCRVVAARVGRPVAAAGRAGAADTGAGRPLGRVDAARGMPAALVLLLLHVGVVRRRGTSYALALSGVVWRDVGLVALQFTLQLKEGARVEPLLIQALAAGQREARDGCRAGMLVRRRRLGRRRRRGAVCAEASGELQRARVRRARDAAGRGDDGRLAARVGGAAHGDGGAAADGVDAALCGVHGGEAGCGGGGGGGSGGAGLRCVHRRRPAVPVHTAAAPRRRAGAVRRAAEGTRRRLVHGRVIARRGARGRRRGRGDAQLGRRRARRGGMHRHGAW
jgi:hypothetical protein